MNRSARGQSVKRFEQSNGLDTALYKNMPLPFSFQTYLAEAILSLRSLFNEPSLQPDDLTTATLTSHDDVTTDLMGQLLMLFLVLSSGGHLVHKTILCLVRLRCCRFYQYQPSHTKQRSQIECGLVSPNNNNNNNTLLQNR